MLHCINISKGHIMENRVVIITGAAQGIGLATAKKFAEPGQCLVLCDQRASKLVDAEKEIRKKGAECVSFGIDVRDIDTVQHMVNNVLEKWNKVDVLINNAGIVKDAQLKNMTSEQFDDVIDVNLRGVYNVTRAVISTMILQQSGVILNTSSIVGLSGNFGQTNYAASKFGVIGMTKTWSKELGKYNIRVNAVCPGFIATDILQNMPSSVLESMQKKVPLGRLGKPEDIAELFYFLASPNASYISGSAIEITGGLTL